IQFDRSFYSIAYQAGRQASDLQSLLNATPNGLAAAGISSDSPARLLNAIRNLGIPSLGAKATDTRMSDNALLLATFDLAPPGSMSGQAYSLTVNGSWNRADPASGSIAELPAHSGRRSNWSANAQLRASGYYGDGLLSETTIGVSRQQFGGSPFLSLPSATVK